MIVLLGEALDLSQAVIQHWEPVDGDDARPGLKTAVTAGIISETSGANLEEFARAVTHAHGVYRAVTANSLQAPVERGEFLLSEMEQCLEAIFDDGVSDDNDASLVRLTESHLDSSSHEALATSLEGFVAVITDRDVARDLLEGLGLPSAPPPPARARAPDLVDPIPDDW